MTDNEKIIRGLKQLSEEPHSSFIATVSDNHPDDDFIDVEDLVGTAYNNVRKRATVDGGKGLIITPAANSFVLVSRIGGSDELYMAMVSIIETVKLSIDDITIAIDNSKVEFNGGRNGGMVISKNTADRLNKIEDDINTLKQDFTAWTPVPNDGGAALKAATASWSDQQLQDTQASDLEDSKVTH
jgi:hypothetical protein